MVFVSNSRLLDKSHKYSASITNVSIVFFNVLQGKGVLKIPSIQNYLIFGFSIGYKFIQVTCLRVQTSTPTHAYTLVTFLNNILASIDKSL